MQVLVKAVHGAEPGRLGTFGMGAIAQKDPHRVPTEDKGLAGVWVLFVVGAKATGSTSEGHRFWDHKGRKKNAKRPIDLTPQKREVPSIPWEEYAQKGSGFQSVGRKIPQKGSCFQLPWEKNAPDPLGWGRRWLIQSPPESSSFRQVKMS